MTGLRCARNSVIILPCSLINMFTSVKLADAVSG
ncbi:hypothetical protein BDI4_1630001 [Burkholderia diffusa]|nr:hypothetical protein BDI4_1630001 [Burkholderia diffusa]